MPSENAFFDPINAKLDKRHEEEEDLKKQKRAAMWGLANNGSSSDEVRNWALGEHQRMLNPETRKRFAQLAPILEKVRGFMGGGQRAPMDEKGPDPNAPVPAPTGPMIDSSIPIKREQEKATFDSNLVRDRTIAINNAKPVTAQGTFRDMVLRVTGAPDRLVRVNSRTNQVVDQSNEAVEIPEGGEIVAIEKASLPDKQYYRLEGDSEDTPPRLMYVDRTNPKHKVDVNTGEAVPEGAKVVDMQTYVAKVRGTAYGTGLYNSWVKSFEGQGFSPSEAAAKAGPVVQEILTRQAENIGATRTTERPGIANGQPVAERFQSTPTPRPLTTLQPGTPASPPPVTPPASAPVPAPPTGTGRTPLPPLNQVAPAPPTRPTAAPVRAPGGPRPLTSLPDAQYRQYLNDFRAVRAGATQIFGDPNTPDVKGLVSYADLADDPGSRARLGKALRLTFDGLHQSGGGGGASVGGEGGSLSVGSVGTYVGNLLNLPSKNADQQAKMFQEAIGSLNPREQEAYNATIAAMEGIIGLRAVTKAGAAQSSVRALQEALPVIGVNTTSSKGFDDKANRLAVEFASGTRGIPSAAMDAETQKQIQEINGLATRRTSKTPAAAGGPVRAPEAKKIRYTVDGKTFDIPEGEVAKFLKDFPGAKKK